MDQKDLQSHVNNLNRSRSILLGLRDQIDIALEAQTGSLKALVDALAPKEAVQPPPAPTTKK